MFKYWQTTSMLLCLCFLFSFVWAVVHYQLRFSRTPRGSRANPGSMPLFPVLLLAPLLLVAGFRLFGINLIYPVSLDATTADMLLAALVPALVLVFASGLIPTVAAGIRDEIGHWTGKPFALMMTACGLETKSMMRRLIITKALITAWMRCMPWLFGEMIIVEVIFNAPGLGLDAWTMARQRNFSALMEALLWLGVLYIFCVLITQNLQRKIGKRLESYS
jgi:ABC-type dipeptide/oligopeptide/nickel transport system permease component